NCVWRQLCQKELQSIPLSNDTVSRRIDDIAEDVEQQLSITHKIHLGQLILQSAQYAYPYIIKLIYVEGKATEKYYLQLFKRKVDGVKHTSKFEGQRDDNQKYYSRGYKKRSKKSLIADYSKENKISSFIWFWDQR
ncbi:hypothetical protein TNCV_3874631, partial [Trichonephila clavipes]